MNRQLNDRRKVLLGKTRMFATASKLRCFVEGAQTVTIFTSMDGAYERVGNGGVVKDWLRVGHDIRAAMLVEKLRREREAG